MGNPKIYDCITINNEMDLLEIRLRELYNIVDYFVIVESGRKFNGEKKPIYFEANKARFKQWEKKIIHLIVNPPKLNILDKITIWLERKQFFTVNKIATNTPLGKWKLDYWHKNQIALGLKDAKDGDIIIFSDADEIIPKKTINEIIGLLNKNPNQVIVVENKNYYYYLNGKTNIDTQGNRAFKYKILREKFNNQPQRIRKNYGLSYLLKGDNIPRKIIKGGWHFSYLGGVEKIKEKIPSIAHSEYDNKKYYDKKNIQESLAKGKDLFGRNIHIKYIKIPKDFPIAIKKFPKKFAHLIKK